MVKQSVLFLLQQAAVKLNLPVLFHDHLLFLSQKLVFQFDLP